MEIDDFPKATTSAVGETGIAIVQEIVMNTSPPGIGWLFRPLPTSDVGIDGQIEVVRREGQGDGRATGRIISVQVKTGASFFDKDKGDHWVVHIRKGTVAYWRAHSVPVILVLVNPETRKCYWARGDADDHQEFKTTFGISVPKSQVLDTSARPMLGQLAANVTTAGARLAKLEGDLPLMERLRRGERLFVNVDQWVNKSSGRMDVSLGTYVERSRNVGTYTYTQTEFDAIQEFGTMGFRSWEEMVRRVFPWVKLVPDEFSEPDEDDLHDSYLSEHGAWDSEDGVYMDVRGEFAEYRDAALDAWRAGFVGEHGSGEVFTYRMEMKLNALGRAFLRVHRHLQRGPLPLSEV